MILFWSLKWPETKSKQGKCAQKKSAPAWSKPGCKQIMVFKKENGTCNQSLQSPKLRFKVSEIFIFSTSWHLLLLLLLELTPGTSFQTNGARITAKSAGTGPYQGLLMPDLPLSRSKVSCAEAHSLHACLTHLSQWCELLQRASCVILPISIFTF